MKLNQWMKIILISGGVLTLVGCHSARKNMNNDGAVNEANAAYTQQAANEDAQTSGAGDETNIGERSVETKITSDNTQLSKRTYYFDFDSSVIKQQDKAAIAANAEYLIAHPKYKIMLEGHTDPRGSREYNIGLGERRAKAIAELLTSKGVNPSQIRIVSYGAEKLASQGRTESDYQLDRRGLVVYIQG